MEYILNLDGAEYTYIGIGSSPHLQNILELNTRWDQLIPSFLLDIINTSNLSIRIIHFDPIFEYNLIQLQSYFNAKLNNTTFKLLHNGVYNWNNERVDVIVVPTNFNHSDDDWFLSKIVGKILFRKFKLVVQQFTGESLESVFAKIYNENSSDVDKKLFKQHILFDITYGCDCNCSTDLAKYKPLYDSNGGFYNFTLYSVDDFCDCIINGSGLSDDNIEFITSILKLKYWAILDLEHYKYRQLVLLGNADDAHICMMNLQMKLMKLLKIFQLLGFNYFNYFDDVFDNYKVYDMYKWHSLVKYAIR